MNPTLELIAQLTTTRRHEFSERDVLPEHLEIIKSVVTKTANSSNRQLYSVIVLGRDRVQAAGLAGSHALVFCVDNSRLQRMAARLGKTCDTSHFLQFVTAAVDVAMLAQSTIIAARSLGLSTWITNDVCLESKADLAALLNLPAAHVYPLLAVCLGYAKDVSRTRKGRLPVAAVFHDNAYAQPEDTEVDEWIARYDDPQSHLALITNWRDLGHAHYLNWFFDKWAPAVGSRKQGEALGDRLRERKLI